MLDLFFIIRFRNGKWSRAAFSPEYEKPPEEMYPREGGTGGMHHYPQNWCVCCAVCKVHRASRAFVHDLFMLFKAVHLLAADVPFRFTALTRSCVVIPCSFQHSQDLILSRGIWSKKAGGVIYHNGRSNILDHFKDRTAMSQDLSTGNCSLEIDDIKPFDNGPFCFHAEKGKDKYRFNNSCVFIVMKGINYPSAHFNYFICLCPN